MTDSQLAVILKTMNDSFKDVFEALGQIQDQMKLLATKTQLQVFADDVKTIKHAVTETNSDLAGHEQRITQLEAKTL